MRIISGALGGRRFTPRKGKFPTRPTTDLAREALFNILTNQTDLENIRFLDLFGGFGGISFEAASRGCRDVTYVDKNPECVRFVKDTSREFEIMDRIKIIRADVEKYVQYEKRPFDVIFADPPYRWPKLSIIPEWIFEKKLLKPNGVLIVEHDTHTYLEHYPQFAGSKKYGHTVFSFFIQPSEVDEYSTKSEEEE